MTTERAWAGGPLRKVGAKSGHPSRYVCDGCQKPVNGIYFVKAWPPSNCDRGLKRGSSPVGIDFIAAPQWLCSTCREEVRPKQEQVATLQPGFGTDGDRPRPKGLVLL
jgi:hypothetical protein